MSISNAVPETTPYVTFSNFFTGDGWVNASMLVSKSIDRNKIRLFFITEVLEVWRVIFLPKGWINLGIFEMGKGQRANGKGPGTLHRLMKIPRTSPGMPI